MIPYLGDFVEDDTVFVMFNTFTSDDPSASSTITNFINTDVHIHKEDDLTQRNNAAGITVSVNFDGITGSHMIKIDTSDDTVGGFWVAGKDYFVRIEGTTVDSATINAVVAHFSIENRYMRGTDSAALASVCTEARLAELAAANLPADLITIASMVTDIYGYTENLPADPASETNVNANETKIDSLDSYLLYTLDPKADAIKAKTDNLPADPASETNVNANETKIDALPTAAEIKTAIEADGSKLDHLWEMTEDDGGVRRLTENALEEAPSGSGATAEEVKTAMEADGSMLEHLHEMTEDDGGVRRFTENALEEAPSGTGGDATAANQNTIIGYIDTEIAAIKAKTDLLNFTGSDVKATLDGEAVKLAADGMSGLTITEPSGDPDGWSFEQKLLWLIMRFLNKHTSDNFNGIRVHKADSSISTTQAVTEAGGVKTVSKAT